MATTFAQIVDEVHGLDQESKHELLEMIRAWLVEERREEICRNAVEAERELALGQVKRGSVDDLMADLHGED